MQSFYSNHDNVNFNYLNNTTPSNNNNNNSNASTNNSHQHPLDDSIVESTSAGITNINSTAISIHKKSNGIKNQSINESSNLLSQEIFILNELSNLKLTKVI